MLITSSFSISAKEFSGVWATECANKKITPKTLSIIRVTKDGLYQLEHPRLQMSKPTAIISAEDLKIINNDTIIYKNVTYKHCSETEIPSYNSVSEDLIKKYLQGKWKPTYQFIGGRKYNLTNNNSGVPDLNFLNEEQATLNLKDNAKPIEYKIDDDNLLLKLDKWKSYKVLLIDQKELQLTIEMKPSKGVFFYYKTKN